MMSYVRSATRVIDRLVLSLEVLLSAIAGMLILSMMIAIVVTIFARWLSLFPTAWIIEVSEYMLLFLTFLVAPWVLRHDAHIRFDLVVSMVPRSSKRFLFYLGNVIGILVMLIIFRYGIEITSNFVDRNLLMINYLRLSKAPFMAVIPLSAALMAYEFLRNLLVGFEDDVERSLEGV